MIRSAFAMTCQRRGISYDLHCKFLGDGELWDNDKQTMLIAMFKCA